MTVTIKGMATIAKPKQTNCNKTKEYNGKTCSCLRNKKLAI